MLPRLVARKQAIAAYCGIVTGPDGNPIPNAPARPLNLTKRGADVLVAHMAANPPIHEFQAKRVMNRGRAKALSLAMDNLNGEIDRIDNSRRWLLNALLSERSIVKIGVRAGDEMVKIQGKLYDPGQPYARFIDNDDHGFDYTARVKDEMRWERHRYRVPREIVESCGLFNPAEIAKLPNISSQTTSPNAALTHLLGGEMPEEAYVTPMVELMDVVFYNGDGSTYLCTCASNPDESTDWLRMVEWTGPERGPFAWLEFYPVPNNLMAVAWQTATAVQELICSRVLNKLVSSISNAKKGVGIKGGEKSESKAVEEGPDGFVINFGPETEVIPMELGGAVKDAFNLLSVVNQQWSVQSGNVDVLAGASTDSKTATEFQGLAANAGVVMSHLQRVYHTFEEGVSRQLAFYLTNDPLRQFMSPMRVPNGEWIDVVYDPQVREDDFNEYETKIRLSSMSAQDPGVLLRRLNEFMGVFLPAGAMDPHEGAMTWGDLAGIPNMESIVPDQNRMMELDAAMMGVPPPQMGTVGGPSQVNPMSLGGRSQQPGRSAGMRPPGVGVGMNQSGMQMTPLAAGMSARAMRVPA